MASALSHVLTLQRIRRLAGATSFARGQAYHAVERVTSLVVRGDTLTATVIGTENYAVRLEATSAGDERFAYRCSCPVGTDGAFCKHCVAVALAWLAAAQPADAGSTTKRQRRAAPSTPLVQLDDVRPWLLEQPPAALADLLLDVAERDARLREKLLRAAARATAKGIDLSAYRRAIERAARPHGFVDYYGAGSYAEGVRDAVEPLRELLAETPEQAAAVIDLVEFALQCVEDALENADDSNGEIGSLLHELQALHLAACQVARPDPEELARRLFEWEIDDHWDVFYNAAETYAELLGKVGLATYRRLAEAEWKKLPALKPGARESFESPRFRLTSIMEALARTSGDVDALVAIKAKDLSSAYQFLTIAELYRDAERPNDALEWAERGLKAFPKDIDARLLEFLALEYHRRGRTDEAMALAWRQFESRPLLETYKNLKSHADKAHADLWPTWRERALGWLRQRIADTPRAARRPFFWSADLNDRSTLVEVLLWENDVDSAWREAQGGDCRDELSLRVATAREKTYPADAIPVYLRHAERLIAQKTNRSYEEAVKHLKKAKMLHLALDQREAWAAVHARLCTEHKAKRNFMALVVNL